MYTREIKNKAIDLRRDGHSFSHISSELGVAKSTLSLWLRDISFLPNKIMLETTEINARKLIKTKKIDKMWSLAKAFDFADKNVGELSDRDLFILGIGIYIGEGSKVGNFVRIANSDPRIIRLSMKWFKKCFGLSDENFRIRIHVYPDNDENKVLNFWVKALNVKREVFYPSSLDKRTNKSRKNKNTLPYGTAHLSVVSNGKKDFGVLLHRKILASIDSVLK